MVQALPSADASAKAFRRGEIPPNLPKGGRKMAKGKEIKITIRLTAEEKERLKKMAEAEGLSLSDLVRKKLQGVRIRRKPRPSRKR